MARALDYKLPSQPVLQTQENPSSLFKQDPCPLHGNEYDEQLSSVVLEDTSNSSEGELEGETEIDRDIEKDDEKHANYDHKLSSTVVITLIQRYLRSDLGIKSISYKDIMLNQFFWHLL